jgi:hypothetical protein
MTTIRNRRPKEPELEPGSEPVKPAEKQANRGQWKKGQSGNPRGAGLGVQHKITKKMQALLLPAVPEVLRGIIADAKAGDPEARKIFTKLVPKMPRYAPTLFNLPRIATAKQAAAQITKILAKAGRGEIDLETFDTVIEALRVFITAHERVELETEVEKYREAMKGKRK